MVIVGVQMWSGLSSDGDCAPWSPLVRVTSICGLTLGCGIDEDLERASFGSEPEQPARGRQSHLRLVSHRRTP